MTSKIRIKLGEVEVEYEGSEEFLKKELPDLLSSISKLYQESTTSGGPSKGAKKPKQGNIAVGTTGTVASKIKAKSGSDLAIAAAAKLMLGDEKSSFSRDQLLTEMKSATTYYKKSYSNNFTKILSGLVKNDKLIETASNTYALTASAKTDLETTLAA